MKTPEEYLAEARAHAQASQVHAKLANGCGFETGLEHHTRSLTLLVKAIDALTSAVNLLGDRPHGT